MTNPCLSTVLFKHYLSPKAVFGPVLVFSVLYDRTRRKYQASVSKAVAQDSIQKDNVC